MFYIMAAEFAVVNEQDIEKMNLMIDAIFDDNFEQKKD